MRDWNKGFKNSLANEEIQRYLRFLAIPFMVIILVIAIVVTDKPKKAETAISEATEETVEVTTGETILPDNKKYFSDFEEYELKQDEIPEIQTLMETYFQARLSADAAMLHKLYGNAIPQDTTEMVNKLKKSTEYIEKYENIVCYTKEGIEENSYVVYVGFDIKFRLTETLAPSLLWCYVKQNEFGDFIIVENPTEEEQKYITYVEQSEDVRLLATQVNNRLMEAVEADSSLASIYHILREGVAEQAGDAASAESMSEDATPAEGESTEAETESLGTEAETESSSTGDAS